MTGFSGSQFDGVCGGGKVGKYLLSLCVVHFVFRQGPVNTVNKLNKESHLISETWTNIHVCSTNLTLQETDLKLGLYYTLDFANVNSYTLFESAEHWPFYVERGKPQHILR